MWLFFPLSDIFAVKRGRINQVHYLLFGFGQCTERLKTKIEERVAHAQTGLSLCCLHATK